MNMKFTPKKKSKIVFAPDKTKESKFAKNSKPRKTAQDTIPFDEVYNNGIVRTENSFALLFSIENLDYKSMRSDEQDTVYKQYMHYLNTLPTEINYQELLISKPIDTEKLSDIIIPKSTTVCERDVFEDFCKINRERIENSSLHSFEQKIIGVISFEPKSSLDDVNELFNHFNELQNQLLSIPIKAQMLSAFEIISLLHNICHFSDGEPFLLPDNAIHNDVNYKDYIAPSSFNFKHKYFEIGEQFACCMYVKRYSQQCDDAFITELLNSTYNIAVSRHIRRIDKEVSLRIMRRQINDLEAQLEKRREINKKRGGSFIPYNLRKKEADLTELQEKLGGTNCDLFEYATYIYIVANSESLLDELKQHIKQVAGRHQVIVDTITGVTMHDKAFRSIFPFANPAKVQDTLIGQPFYLTTDEVGNFIPFSYLNIVDKSGLCYGINPITQYPIVLDRSEALNSNGFILGTSGSGKSMTVKLELISAMMKYPNDEFIIIDPDNEYRALAEPFNAEIIKLSPNTDTHINIFDTDINYTEDGQGALAMKSNFLMTVIEAIKSTELTSQEKTIIDRVTRSCYAKYQNTSSKDDLPTLTTFYQTLKQQSELEAKDLATMLELYVTGSFNAFAHPTNIKYHKRFVIWDIAELGEQLKTVGSLVLLEMVWQRVIKNKNRGIRTWLWTDEFSIFFNDTNHIYSTGVFFEKVYKRIRKYGGVATGATQNITEVLQSKQATTMLQNAEFLVLLAQKPNDLETIQNTYSLSNSQVKHIDTDKNGTGLIFLGKKIVPFENIIPKDNKIYKICSTKFKDLQEQKKKLVGD